MPMQAVAPLVLFVVLFVGYCLNDLRTAHVQHLPKWAWAILILVSVPFGGIAYLALGRRDR
ncbi:MAG: PLDc N-terminal domain-containing protein [Dehalococcoidia bacterium]|nr:PLDc N-terminal domain-containing protein [Dehalococcoidia bacterium]